MRQFSFTTTQEGRTGGRSKDFEGAGVGGMKIDCVFLLLFFFLFLQNLAGDVVLEGLKVMFGCPKGRNMLPSVISGSFMS